MSRSRRPHLPNAPAEPTRRDARGLWPWMLLPLVAAAIVHAPALGNYFSADDVTFLARARGLEPTIWAFRPLSEALAFRALNALFGLEPIGYRAFGLALHLANTAWVGAIGARLSGSPGAGLASAMLFGVSFIAFMPLHWSAGLVELLSAQFVLLGTWLWIEGREHDRALARVGALACGLAAALSKEVVVVWPLALAALELRSGLFRARLRLLVWPLVVSLVVVAVFFGTDQPGRFSDSEAYRRTFAPGALAANLGTYLGWLAGIGAPARDAVGATNAGVATIALAVAAAWWIVALIERRGPRHPAEVGAVWFLVFLAPVLTLAHHSYLYYLYLPWAGACWTIASAGARLSGRLPARAAAVAALAVLATVALLEARSVRRREHDTLGGLPRDRVVREGALLRRVIGSLAAERLPEGTAIALVNPLPMGRVSLVGELSDGAARSSYLPIEAALRGGDAIRLFLPGLEWRGFGTGIPPEWHDTEIFLFAHDGTLLRWGTGQSALIHLASAQLEDEQWAPAVETLGRVRALGDTMPSVLRRQIAAFSHLGREAEAVAVAREYLDRWPGDPQAAVLRELLQRR